jgi:LPXTG-motif cell wall-anchored protein
MKKLMKKLIAGIAAMTMVLAMGITAFAANAGTPQSPRGSITIQAPDNTAADKQNTYKIYKIFGATVASDNTTVAYKLLDGYSDNNVPIGFIAQNGYITSAPSSLDDTASAIAAYVTNNNLSPVDTVTITGPTTGTSKALDPGYYYVATTTGSAVIVNANQSTSIKDKNVLSTVDKVAGTEYSENAKQAIQAVGQDQPFTVRITKGKGAGHIAYTDTMTNMTFNAGTLSVTTTDGIVDSTNYTVVPAPNNLGFTLTFTDQYIKDLADNTVITLHYTAKITSDALQTNPAKNTASLTLDNSNTTTSSDVEIYNGKLTVTKVDGEKRPLQGAGFKLKNEDGQYYTVTVEDTSKVVSWTANGTEVFANTGDNKNVAEFTGLPGGTFTLVESTVPAGYNKADDKEFTVSLAKGDSGFTNLTLSTEVENLRGATLPSTGGMGTTIFYALGAALAIGAGVVLVTRKRLSK